MNHSLISRPIVEQYGSNMGLKITTYSTFIYFSQKFFNLQKFNLYCLKAYKNTHRIKFFLKSIYKDSLANPILSFWNRPQMEPDGPLWELFIWPKYAPRAQNTDSIYCNTRRQTSSTNRVFVAVLLDQDWTQFWHLCTRTE